MIARRQRQMCIRDRLLPGVGSAVALETVAVFVRVPEAAPEIEHIAVKVAEPPTGRSTKAFILPAPAAGPVPPPAYAVSYTHLRAHETVLDLVCRLLLEKKKQINH